MMLEDVKSVIELHQLLEEKKDCMFQFLQDESLLHSSCDCPKCGRRMCLQNFPKYKFQFTWRCSKHRCRATVSVTYDSFFWKSVMDVNVVFLCLFLWCVGVSAKVATDTLGVSSKSVFQVFEYVRDICSWQLLQVPEEFHLGGPDKEVELFQTQYSEKKTDDSGILVIYCREDKRGVLQVLKNREADTVTPIIKECVLPGSTVYSDLSPAYKTLPLLGYKHVTVASLKRSKSTKSVSGATITNMAKGYWAACKRKLTAWGVVNSKNFDRHLDVLMWRDLYAREEVKDTFKNILDHIRSRYETKT